jgi:hypothetical protein
MIRPGDRVRWDTQVGRTIADGDSSDSDAENWNVVPAGTGIVFAVARGNIPGDTRIIATTNRRSYIVRSDEDFMAGKARKVIWLVDIHPEWWRVAGRG